MADVSDFDELLRREAEKQQNVRSAQDHKRQLLDEAVVKLQELVVAFRRSLQNHGVPPMGVDITSNTVNRGFEGSGWTAEGAKSFSPQGYVTYISFDRGIIDEMSVVTMDDRVWFLSGRQRADFRPIATECLTSHPSLLLTSRVKVDDLGELYVTGDDSSRVLLAESLAARVVAIISGKGLMPNRVNRAY